MLAFFVTFQVENSWSITRTNKCSEVLTYISFPIIELGSADQYFTRQFIEELKANDIQLSFSSRVIQIENQKHIYIELNKNRNIRVGKLKLTPDIINQGTIELSELNLMDPRPHLKSDKKHQTQIHKGLPFSFFQSFKRQLFAQLKKSGYKKVIVEGSQDYTVLLLYLKTMKAELSSPKGKSQIEYLDSIFRKLKAQPNLPFEMNSRNDLSKIIKSVEEPSNQFEFEEVSYNRMSTQERNQTYEHIYDDSGYLIALYKKQLTSEESPRVFLIDPFSKKKVRFIHWSRWQSQMSLSFEINL